MAEPITIKKKKLTIKSRTAKTATPVATGGGDGSDAEGSSVLQAAVAAPVAKPPSYTLVAILALLATLMFIGVIAIQWTEWSYLKSAFPRPIQAGPIVSN